MISNKKYFVILPKYNFRFLDIFQSFEEKCLYEIRILFTFYIMYGYHRFGQIILDRLFF